MFPSKDSLPIMEIFSFMECCRFLVRDNKRHIHFLFFFTSEKFQTMQAKESCDTKLTILQVLQTQIKVLLLN